MSRWDNNKETKKRKVSAVVTEMDRETLRNHYTFLPAQQASRSTWQDRMVLHYHCHLYKDVVLANMTRVKQRQLGLRWRTAAEVRAGRGTETCGNLHCPSWSVAAAADDDDKPHESESQRLRAYIHGACPDQEDQEKHRVSQLAHGALCTDFEVPFTYSEQGETKTELVKLRLCIRCAPLLFQSKGDKQPYLAACRARRANLTPGIGESEEIDDSSGLPEMSRKRIKSDDNIKQEN